VFWCILQGCSNPWGIRPPSPYKYKGDNILRCSTHTIDTKPVYSLSFTLFSHLFFFLFFVAAAWLADRRQRSSRAVRPARAAHSHCTPLACGVSDFKRSHWCVLRIVLPMRLLRWCVLPIALIIRGTMFECEHTLGIGRPKIRLGPSSSYLVPFRCDHLIKHHTSCMYN
jgi:hypothetical protein